jgi:hypothetical protein
VEWSAIAAGARRGVRSSRGFGDGGGAESLRAEAVTFALQAASPRSPVAVAGSSGGDLVPVVGSLFPFSFAFGTAMMATELDNRWLGGGVSV